MVNRQMTEAEIIAYERRLSEQLEDDRTRDPHADRHRAFITGWNRADKGREYTPKTLERLKWDNLGYRMRKKFGPQSAEQRDRVYTVLAEHRKRFLESERVLVEVSGEEGLEWVEQQESDEGIERRRVERLEQHRDRKKAAVLKQHYDDTCMFCGMRLQVAEDRFYSEAAHIRGVGKPHNGPDKASNMLVLCPNHHIQFDEEILRLHKVDTLYRIESKATADPLHGKTIAPTHPIDDDCVKYHRDYFE